MESRKRTSTELEKPVLSYSEKMALNYGSEVVKPTKYAESLVRTEEPKEDEPSNYVWEELSPTKKTAPFKPSKPYSEKSEGSDEDYEEAYGLARRPHQVMTQPPVIISDSDEDSYNLSQSGPAYESPVVAKKNPFVEHEQSWAEEVKASTPSIISKPIEASEALEDTMNESEAKGVISLSKVLDVDVDYDLQPDKHVEPVKPAKSTVLIAPKYQLPSPTKPKPVVQVSIQPLAAEKPQAKTLEKPLSKALEKSMPNSFEKPIQKPLEKPMALPTPMTQDASFMSSNAQSLDMARSNIISGLGIDSDSESSSSEDEAPEPAVTRSASYVTQGAPIAIPSTSLSSAKANSSSKAILIERKETQGGLNPTSRSGGCSACHLF